MNENDGDNGSHLVCVCVFSFNVGNFFLLHNFATANFIGILNLVQCASERASEHAHKIISRKRWILV